MARLERDLLGELALPDEALYGIQSARAFDNFALGSGPVRSEIIRALAQVKLACAQANMAGGHLSERIGQAIAVASEEVARGEHAEQFLVDALQGGAGTSTNMNVNEVVANRASQLAGARIDALEHVNLHQSTNDVYPTALRVAAIGALRDLEPAQVGLLQAFQDKEREFAGVLKLGRTELRDAVPTTLGRTFGAYACAMGRDRWRISKCVERLRVVNLGGTAIGTGLAAPREYIFLAIEKLREVTGLNLARAENLVDATQNQDALVEVSGILRAHASTLVKIARDLRLMASGPEGGLGEIELPALQPGSSLMPGKINPVIPEMVTQVGFRVMAHDYELNLVAMSGELELNAFLPLAADALIRSIRLLERADALLRDRCIAGIRANVAHCRDQAERSPEIVTGLIPKIGHARAVDVASLMRAKRIGVRAAVAELGILTESELGGLLEAERLCALGWRADEREPQATTG